MPSLEKLNTISPLVNHHQPCVCVNCEIKNLWPLVIVELEAWRDWNDRIIASPQSPPTQKEVNEAGKRVLEARKALEEA